MASSKTAGKSKSGISRRPSVRSGKPNGNQGDRPTTDLVPSAETAALPEWLVRSPVYNRVPMFERSKLDHAIIFRPAGMASLQAIADAFKLTEKYQVSLAELTAYADKIEQLVRPEITSHVLAGVLGCLPKSYRRQIVDGSEVLLISRLFKALNDQDTTLTVAEMAKLASILLSLARRPVSAGGKPGRQKMRPGHRADEPDANGQEPIKLAETVRLLYGLKLNPAHEPDPTSAKAACE